MVCSSLVDGTAEFPRRRHSHFLCFWSALHVVSPGYDYKGGARVHIGISLCKSISCVSNRNSESGQMSGIRTESITNRVILSARLCEKTDRLRDRLFWSAELAEGRAQLYITPPYGLRRVASCSGNFLTGPDCGLDGGCHGIQSGARPPASTALQSHSLDSRGVLTQSRAAKDRVRDD